MANKDLIDNIGENLWEMLERLVKTFKDSELTKATMDDVKGMIGMYKTMHDIHMRQYLGDSQDDPDGTVSAEAKDLYDDLLSKVRESAPTRSDPDKQFKKYTGWKKDGPKKEAT